MEITATTTKEGRTYHTPDGDFPSITTILGKTGDKTWLRKWRESIGEEEADRIAKEAADRGTKIHEYAEKFFNEESFSLDNEPLDVQEMTKNLLKAAATQVSEVWHQELAIWDKKYRFAGRLDMVGRWNGIPSIIDFKTSKKLKLQENIKDYYLQCTAYAIAFSKLYKQRVTNCVILITVENPAKVQSFEFNAEKYVLPLELRLREYYRNHFQGS